MAWMNMDGATYRDDAAINSGLFNKKLLLKFLACCIYIQGNERRRDERFSETRKLRSAFDKAREHFRIVHPTDLAPASGILEFLSSRFLSHEISFILSLNISRAFFVILASLLPATRRYST